MVTFTDSQVGEMLARLARVQEIAIAIDEERVYWKGVAEKLRETVDERERAIDWFDKRIKFAEEELAELAATVNDYANESVRLKQVAHQNAVAADGFAREVAMLREHNRIQSNTNSCYNWLLHNLNGMQKDYAAHRGRYGGTGVAEELVKLMNGELYVEVKEQAMTTKELDTFEDLLGRTLSAVEVNSTMDELVFTLDNGEQYMLYHEQDCCEAVSIEDICGDLSDLVGSPILMAEEASNSDDPKPDDWDDSWTWTFYKLATLKGYVTIRWYGESNGYYSERVDWCKV